MTEKAKDSALARGEATSEIRWGKDAQEVVELLLTKYGIAGEEADTIIAEAIEARRSHVRKKATIALAFSIVGLAVPITYFAIQGFVGFVVIGFGPILMVLFGVASLALAGRSIARLITGDTIGPA